MSDEEFVLIPLVNGGFAKVSPEDRFRVSPYTWYKDKGGYAYIRITMHRFLLEVPKGITTDHKNGDRLDNRRSNIRLATPKENNQNTRPKQGKRKGVHYDRRCERWQAHIRIDGKLRHIGSFDDEDIAAHAYDSAALYYFKEFASTNFPDGIPRSIEDLRHRKPKTSKYWGVSLYSKTKKWVVMIGTKRTYIGSFDSEEAAARAYDEAAKKLYGAKAKLNFPTGD